MDKLRLTERVTCEHCNGTGHAEDCPVNEPAWDFGDLVARPDCTGCCPAGCSDNSEAREAARRYKKWLGRRIVWGIKNGTIQLDQLEESSDDWDDCEE